MKTKDGWERSDQGLDVYLTPGDEVDEAMADYFLEVLPPASNAFMRGCIQIGEPNDHGGPNDSARYATVIRKDRRWWYVGHWPNADKYGTTDMTNLLKEQTT